MAETRLEKIRGEFRVLWLRFFTAALCGQAASRNPNEILDEDGVADDAASIADSALDQYKKRWE